MIMNLPQDTNADVQQFGANTTSSSVNQHQWVKRRGVSMVYIILGGAGGNGGNGAVGAASTAAGGGGGGSGTVGLLLIPAVMCPDTLWLSIPFGGAGPGAITAVSLVSSIATPAANTSLFAAGCASNGGNAAGATGGGAGNHAAPGILSFNLGLTQNLANSAPASAGGTTGVGTVINGWGAIVTGGTGGAGLGIAGSAGSAGGGYVTLPPYPAIAGGLGASSATTPAGAGSHGLMRSMGTGKLFLASGGMGGGSTNGSATGAGLVGGRGGDGIMGSGGGGGGGALTGSVQGLGGRGGDGWAFIISW